MRMSLSRVRKLVFKAFPNINEKKFYRLHRSAVRLMRSQLFLEGFYKLWDNTVSCGGRDVRVRIFRPANETADYVIMFYHGGGWVTDSVETYTGVCMRLSEYLGCRIISVDYGLAPEHRFPEGFADCYNAARELARHPYVFGTDKSKKIVLMGDSAGGNLAAAVSTLARDRKEFSVAAQVLVYPAVWCDYNEETTPFESVRENGKNYVLTASRMRDYMDLYKSSDNDYRSPYFSPMRTKSFADLPKTLILTAEYDPLRDEGIAYGKEIRKAGGQAAIYIMNDAIHGFLMSDRRSPFVRKSFAAIKKFLIEVMF